MLSGDTYRVAQDSTHFHEVIVELADNTLMRSVMRSLSGRMMWQGSVTSSIGAGVTDVTGLL